MAGPALEYTGFLPELADKLIAFLIAAGWSRERAEALARALVDSMRRNWGGTQVYIPSQRPIDRLLRDAEIARRWNGRNTLELCREFGISDERVRQIYDEARRKAKSVSAGAQAARK
ncbi:MAG: hypothetical protein HYY78_12285 [Betaproteobacteria bacterium]|nr:hypothetical protein [Betaproteobacteria bacterium]